MFLKQITAGKDIKFVYRNQDNKLNTIVASGMLGEIVKRLNEIGELYSKYLSEGVGFCKISISGKEMDKATISVSTSINGVSGGFSFAHNFARIGEQEIKALEAQEMFEVCEKYRVLNLAYDVILELSAFLEENLLNVQGVEREQLELFQNN